MNKENSNPQGNVANTSGESDALCCEATTTYEGRIRFTNVWFIRSGVICHMTSQTKWFHHYEPISEGSVYNCDDHTLNIVSIGTIKLKFHVGTMRIVREVRHMEGLRKNLLSLG